MANTVTVDLRVLAPASEKQSDAVIELDLQPITSVNALCKYLESLNVYPRGYHIERDSMELKWSSQNGADVLETLQLLRGKSARASLMVTAVRDEGPGRLNFGGDDHMDLDEDPVSPLGEADRMGKAALPKSRTQLSFERMLRVGAIGPPNSEQLAALERQCGRSRPYQAQGRGTTQRSGHSQGKDEGENSQEQERSRRDNRRRGYLQESERTHEDSFESLDTAHRTPRRKNENPQHQPPQQPRATGVQQDTDVEPTNDDADSDWSPAYT
ncbi:hypothetical protein MMC28_000544 [Mycoblastus sanguinarius]|nr:hypothetical protein [Mycoblastus sanguinarius]